MMDLTTLRDNNVFEEFRKTLDGLKIGILFNNAGIAEYKLLRYVENTHKEMTK